MVAGGDRYVLGYRPALDRLRGVAILFVVADHVQLPLFGGAGQIGVTMFFVLSGFLITQILLDEHRVTGRISLLFFYARRALRLLPALFVLLLVVSAGAVTVGDGRVLSFVPSVLLYFANWAQVGDGHAAPVLGHTWSLAIEEQFYALWPLLLILGLRWRSTGSWLPVALVAAAIGSVVMRAVIWHPTIDAYYRVVYGTDTRAEALLIGGALAAMYATKAYRPGALITANGIALILAVLVVPSIGFFVLIGLSLVTVGACVLTALAATGRAGVLSWSWLVWLGGISYGVYLWHVPVLDAARWVGVPG
ncbi:MAG TPA: acyltransferase, partial [Candidatus Limnocylindria bacterium]